MEPFLIWIIIGFSLIILELMTGTFYLLVLGIGAFGGAILAWAGAGYFAQSLGASVVSLVGAWLVHRWHLTHRSTSIIKNNFLDLGQPVVFESWVDSSARTARVKYRGTTWDAVITQPGDVLPGTTLLINGQDGSILLVGLPTH